MYAIYDSIGPVKLVCFSTSIELLEQKYTIYLQETSLKVGWTVASLQSGIFIICLQQNVIIENYSYEWAYKNKVKQEFHIPEVD